MKNTTDPKPVTAVCVAIEAGPDRAEKTRFGRTNADRSSFDAALTHSTA